MTMKMSKLQSPPKGCDYTPDRANYLISALPSRWGPGQRVITYPVKFFMTID
jgi:hypothetical protein